MKNWAAIRLALLIGFMAMAAILDAANTHSQLTAKAFQVMQESPTPLSVQQEEIAELRRTIDRLEKHIDYDDTRVADIQDEQHTWKGIVVGIGSVIAILELLQALGFARRGNGGRYVKAERITNEPG